MRLWHEVILPSLVVLFIIAAFLVMTNMMLTGEGITWLIP